jgi:hypothetical protein
MRSIHRSVLFSGIALAVAGAFAVPSLAQMIYAVHPPVMPKLIMSWGGMYGDQNGFVGAAGTIRGIPGAPLPWVVSKSAKGSLTSSGRLSINVKGLIIPNDPNVPEGLGGTNPDPTFRGIVSCLTTDPNTPVNVPTDPVPASPKGDAKISAKLTLPNPCVAPIVFITSGEQDVWFATTGVATGN